MSVCIYFRCCVIMKIGDKIPEIFGVDQSGNVIKASDYRGRKLVLFCYPKANTPVVLLRLVLCNNINQNWKIWDMQLLG